VATDGGVTQAFFPEGGLSLDGRIAPPRMGILSYIIEAGSVPGLSNLVVSDTGGAATTFIATAGAGTYYVRMRTKNACGTSAPSNEVTLVVGSGGTPTAQFNLSREILGTSRSVSAFVQGLHEPLCVRECAEAECVMDTVRHGAPTNRTRRSGVVRVREPKRDGVGSERHGPARVPARQH